MGTVSNALGVGGVLGRIANGINIGSANNRSISTTYYHKRIMAIPAHGKLELTSDEFREVNGSVVEQKNKEFFGLTSHPDFCSKKGINKGEIVQFSEHEIPWKRNYVVTYSLSSDFDSYSTLNAELFIHALYGVVDDKSIKYSIDGYIAGHIMPIDYEKITSKYNTQDSQVGWQKYIYVFDDH